MGAIGGREIEVRNPSTDELIASVPEGDAADATRAVAAAAALPAWRALPGSERARVLRGLFDLMVRDAERLATIQTRQLGRPITETRGEIAYAAGFIEWSTEEAERVYGETPQAFVPDERLIVIRQPIGVAAGITPWNFPSSMITRKLGPALAAGCTMVVKPASRTPLTGLTLGELVVEAGFPPGVVNILTGKANAIAETLLADARVRALSFTGSTEVGKRLMVLAAQHVMKLGLELGGHAPVLVFDDADLDVAVRGTVASRFRNSGQTCICANRVYVQAGIHDRFLEALTATVSALRSATASSPG